MKLIARQKIWLTIVVVGNAALWIIPSDVVELIARDRHTLLGRYSYVHFTWNMVALIISALSFYVDWSTGETYKKRWFRVLASLGIFALLLFLADFAIRLTDRSQRYVIHDGLIVHRPPGAVYRERVEDKPSAARSYPDAPPGYAARDCTLTVDTRGYRNKTDRDTYDIVVLGDSFAEGSDVSDEDPWPVRLAEKTGRTVCNLGMSGNEPIHYRATLERFGLALKPRIVVCMLYEGNDFRSAKSLRKQMNPSFSKRVKAYFKRSPILGAVESTAVQLFGPMRADAQVEGIEILSWLPLAIPSGEGAAFYAFAPKQIIGTGMSAEQFGMNKRWFQVREVLESMREICAESGAKFVIVYAPTKAHVALPLVFDALPAKKVHAFAALREDDLPPEPTVFMERLRGTIDGCEQVVTQWCGEKSISFVSTTSALRDAVAAGQQAYFTYDQHWTPIGHQIVAEVVGTHLARFQPPTKPRTADGD